MPNEKDLSSTGVVANIWTLNNFEIETTIKLLIQKNVFTKEKFMENIFKRIEQGENEAAKIWLKEQITSKY